MYNSPSMSQAAAWIILGIFSLIRLEADYLLVVGVCLTLSLANIVGFTKCNKGMAYLHSCQHVSDGGKLFCTVLCIALSNCLLF